MDGAVLQALLADAAAAAPTPAPTLTSGNTLVLWADAQVPPAVLARLAQHKLLLALERPCRTGGRRSTELLLAAASGRLTWEQVLVGAVCSAQLESEPPAAGATCAVVPCNGCHARHNEACGRPQAAGDGGPTACWRLPSPDTGRRDWLSHGEVQALYQTQLGAAKTLQYIEAHRAEVDQVVRRALLGMGQQRDADLGAAQAALRDPADPLAHLCTPGAGDRRPRELLGLVTAGVEALVAAWAAFERSWHAEWLALRAATPPSELDPKLRQLTSPPGSWDPRQLASVRKRVARCSPRFRLHVLLLQLPADPGAPYTAWLDGALVSARKPAATLLASCATHASTIPRQPAGPAVRLPTPQPQDRQQPPAQLQQQKAPVRLFGVDLPAKPPTLQQQQQQQQQQQHRVPALQHQQQRQPPQPQQLQRHPPPLQGLQAAPASLALAIQQAQMALHTAGARQQRQQQQHQQQPSPTAASPLADLPPAVLAQLAGLGSLPGLPQQLQPGPTGAGAVFQQQQHQLSAVAAMAAAAAAAAGVSLPGMATGMLPPSVLLPSGLQLPPLPPPGQAQQGLAPAQQQRRQQQAHRQRAKVAARQQAPPLERAASVEAQQEAALQLLNLAKLIPELPPGGTPEKPRTASPAAAEPAVKAATPPLSWPKHCRARRSSQRPLQRDQSSAGGQSAELSVEDEEAVLALEGMGLEAPSPSSHQQPRPASRWRIPRTRGAGGRGGGGGGLGGGRAAGPRGRVEGPCTNPECRSASSPCWRKGPPSMPVLCNACGTRWARSANSDKVPSAAHGGGSGEDERGALDFVPGQARASTPGAKPTAAAAQRISSRSRSASPALSALAGTAASPAALVAARAAPPSPLKPALATASPGPSSLKAADRASLPKDAPAAAGAAMAASDAAAKHQAAMPVQAQMHTPRLPPRRPAAAAAHTAPRAGVAAAAELPDAAAAAIATSDSASAAAAVLATSQAEEAMMSAAADMLRESAAQGRSEEAGAAQLAAERMAALEPQARSRVIAAGLRAAISAPMALPNSIASSFAAAFMQRGAPFPLRGGAPIPPQFADGWPTVDGRTLSASFLDSASRQKAKQDLKGLGGDLARRTSAPAAPDPSTPVPSAAVRAAALSAPTAAASASAAAAAGDAAEAAKAAGAPASRAADADVDRPLTPALASASPRLDASRAAAAVPGVPDSASTDATDDAMTLPKVRAVGAELAQLLGRSSSPGLPSPTAPADPEAMWAAAEEYVAEARADGRLLPRPPTPPRTPPLFGLPPLEPLGLHLGLGTPAPRKRKAPAPAGPAKSGTATLQGRTAGIASGGRPSKGSTAPLHGRTAAAAAAGGAAKGGTAPPQGKTAAGIATGVGLSRGSTAPPQGSVAGIPSGVGVGKGGTEPPQGRVAGVAAGLGPQGRSAGRHPPQGGAAGAPPQGGPLPVAARRPGDFLAAAGGIMPLPAPKRAAPRDPRGQLQGRPPPPAAAPAAAAPPPQPARQSAAAEAAAAAGSVSHPSAPSRAVLNHSGALPSSAAVDAARLGPRRQEAPASATPVSSAATLTASEHSDGGGDDSDCDAAQSPGASKQRRRKRKRLFTGGRRPPPAARGVAGAAAAAEAPPHEDDNYVPLDMGGEVRYGSISSLYKKLPTVSAGP